jgi:hypothetical protein
MVVNLNNSMIAGDNVRFDGTLVHASSSSSSSSSSSASSLISSMVDKDEEMDEEEFKSIHSGGDIVPDRQNNSGSDDTTTNDDFDIARQETKAVFRSKLLLLTIIAVAAASFGAATYVLTRDEENGTFQNEVSAFYVFHYILFWFWGVTTHSNKIQCCIFAGSQLFSSSVVLELRAWNIGGCSTRTRAYARHPQIPSFVSYPICIFYQLRLAFCYDS